MKKRMAYFTIILLVCSGVLFLSYDAFLRYFILTPYVISSVSVRNGDSLPMINGIEYYINQVNKQGGIRGKPVILKKYNDFGNPQLAKKIATEISKDNETLIVLGHYFSSCSESAGRVYQQNGVPAITGSASSDQITQENSFYFRLLPPNKFQSTFLAHYIKYTLNKKVVSIIYEKDPYGKTLYYAFVDIAKNINLKITNVCGISTDVNQDFHALNKNLSKTTEKTIVVFAHASLGAKLLTYLNYPGSGRTIIGSDSFSTNAFSQSLHAIPQERSVPGYFSDNLYAVMPFLKEFGSFQTFNFIEKYKKRFHCEPNWVAFTYHDAALTAIKAIEQTEMKNRSIHKIRQSIRNELAGMYSFKKSVKGLTGSIFFDKIGNVINSIGIGQYKKGQLYPAYSQYQFLPNVNMNKSTFKEAMQGKIITIDDIYLKRTSIVLTGVKLQKIHDIDLDQSTYEIEFLIWFRHKGDLNVADIEFEDALTPINPGPPIVQKLEGDVTYSVFRARGVFKNKFILYNFPFDTHTLRLRYHHVYIPNYTLIYVPDEHEFNKYKMEQQHVYNDWKIYKTLYFQDLNRFEVSPGKHVDYSQFNINWHIKRIGNGIIYRCIIPLILILIISIFIVFIPPQRIGLRLLLIIAIFCTGFVYYSNYSKLIYNTDYTLFDFLYLILFCYQIIIMLFSILIFIVKNKRTLVLMERILLPVFICLMTFLFIYHDAHLYFSKTISKGESSIFTTKGEHIKLDSKDWVFIVEENAKTNTYVGKLSRPHLDDKTISYDILSGNEKKTFSLQPDTGKLYVANNSHLDYEMQNIFTLKIAVIEQTEVIQVSNVIIHVKNLNEAPILQPATISINENIPEFSIIASNLKAFDPDNDTLSYTIVSGNQDKRFTINPNEGDITMDTSPDYEMISSYTLVVKASDNHGLSSVQPVRIVIENVNEKPVFEDQSFSYKKNKTIIGKIIAHDPENSPVSFRIKNQDSMSSNFYIEDSTLKVSDNFTFQEKNSCTLLLEASDNDGLTATANIRINFIIDM
ncbi:MAG: hypothetical protein OMM_00882 [Candidatus Magnetoglobus multicellularis str. Araruama]|uniref:Cadherin domain-containing protein n=1 Tax=Candidatus Magnetoglobus multicellularis str. Araruama TaxID=890399 RepID=A0A1V1PF32_9BACT|nr:MAG: hypothetical protein OMM_00882 [Candidatus Magnetoglobus multicellularis str. Araruama]